ncbi:MAG: DUF1330 domain-containing protein [Pseudomonadota bacterium]|jgi:uncharacterized protein (DUF1330 family)|nr:DUF1330 domain-containing protein [Pseudomonadota bacterium]
MPGYIITNAEVFDKDAYGEYGKLAPDAIKKYGGKFLTRGGAAEILEGNWEPHRIVVVKFDSVEQAKAMYNSPEYQAAKEKRIGAADFNMIVVEGN